MRRSSEFDRTTHKEMDQNFAEIFMFNCTSPLQVSKCRNGFKKCSSNLEDELDQRNREKCNCLGKIAKVDPKNGKYQMNILLIVNSRDLSTAPCGCLALWGIIRPLQIMTLVEPMKPSSCCVQVKRKGYGNNEKFLFHGQTENFGINLKVKYLEQYKKMIPYHPRLQLQR